MKKLAAFFLVVLVVATSLLALAGKQKAWTLEHEVARGVFGPDREDEPCAGDHNGGLRLGALYKKNGYWCRDAYCQGCDAFVGTNFYEIPAGTATTLPAEDVPPETSEPVPGAEEPAGPAEEMPVCKHRGERVKGGIYKQGQFWYWDLFCADCGGYVYTNMVVDLDLSRATTIPAN